jgi:hypothetical protein
MNSTLIPDRRTTNVGGTDLRNGDPWRAAGGVVETTVLLTTDLLVALESAASERKMSVGRLVRELIKHHLASSAEQPPDGRQPDRSTTADVAQGSHQCS